jgi:hypothetical protein
MPLDFPPSPALNEIYSYNGSSWQWNGRAWNGLQQATGIQKSNIWAKQNLLIPKRGFGLNSGYNGTTDQRRTAAGTIPGLKHYIERDSGEFSSTPDPWTPAQITTSLWLDAADVSTIILNGSTVSQWNDKSGNSRNVSQANASLQPLYTLNGLNSLNIANFDGSNDVLNGIAMSNFFSPTSYSAFVVGRARTIVTDDVNGYPNEAFYGDAGGYVAMYLRSSNLIGAYNWDGTNKVATTAYTANTFVIGYAELSGSNIRIRTNGGSETITATSATQVLTGTIQIGRNWNSDVYCLDGEIAEVIFTNAALSNTNRQLIEGYLAHKWGMQANLPNDHPYKSSAPTV